MDPVDHPTHYNHGKIEAITFIEDQQLDFHLGNVVKYICRAKHKGNEYQDLLKALWYLERHIKNLENEHDRSGHNERDDLQSVRAIKAAGKS
jgi:hypothetical protein